jgi:hypothetical protein
MNVAQNCNGRLRMRGSRLEHRRQVLTRRDGSLLGKSDIGGQAASRQKPSSDSGFGKRVRIDVIA